MANINSFNFKLFSFRRKFMGLFTVSTSTSTRSNARKPQFRVFIDFTLIKARQMKPSGAKLIACFHYKIYINSIIFLFDQIQK